MAKFCRYCGKQLEDGMICDCEAQKQAEAQKPAEPVYVASEEPVKPEEQAYTPEAEPIITEKKEAPAFDIKSEATGIWATIKSFLTSPDTAGAEVVRKKDFKQTLIFIGAQALTMAILLCAMAGQWNRMVGDVYTSSFRYNIFIVFFVGLIFSAVFSGAVAAIIFLAAKIFKGKLSFFESLSLSSLTSVYTVPLMTVAILFALLFPLKYDAGSALELVYAGPGLRAYIPPVLAILGLICGGFLIFNTVRELDIIDKNKSYYFIAAVIAGSLIAGYILYSFAHVFCSPSAFNPIVRATKTLGNAIDDLLDF